MVKGFSKVILVGNLTQDVEVKTTPSGQSVANFSLAVNRSWKGSDGQTQEQTSFINCVAWGKAGEIIAQYTSKGSGLLVSGRLDQRSYEDKDGNKRQAVEVYVEDFNFVGGRGDNTATESASKFVKNETKGDSLPSDDQVKDEIDLSEIPF